MEANIGESTMNMPPLALPFTLIKKMFQMII
jgi:hypothetical protein